MEDAYKWLFQATRGAEHALGDRAMVQAWLDEEWAGLKKPFRGEPLFVSLRPDGSLVRLNLRPFRAMGGTKTQVMTLFLHAGAHRWGSEADFEGAWEGLARRLFREKSERLGSLSFEDWTNLDRKTRPKEFPAIDHSSSYEKARMPAYRLALGTELAALLKRHRK